MKNKFFTQQGWLTLYALACGYLHETRSDDITITLSENNIGLNTFEIKVYSSKEGRLLWDIAKGLPQARKAYVNACKAFLNKKPARRFERASDISRDVYA